MNFVIIIALFATCISAARLGFHGSRYNYGQFGSLSPKQALLIKKLLKLKCLQKHGQRFC